MISKVLHKIMSNEDTTTYILVGIILVTVLLGALKIIFF